MTKRAALRWVRSHIGAFGGNGEDVTLFGQSAGGNAILNHLVQNASLGLFRKAVVSSGTYDQGACFMGGEGGANQRLSQVLSSTGCDRGGGGGGGGEGGEGGGDGGDGGMACLQAMDAQCLLETVSSWGWGPVVDGVSLIDLPLSLILQGRYNKIVPILIGSNRDEAAFWTLQSTNPNLDETGYSHVLSSSGLSGEEVVQLQGIQAREECV